MKKIILTCVIVFMLCNLSFAEDIPIFYDRGGLDAILASKDTFFIEVDSRVKDGCLPNPGRLKNKIEISLRKNGFVISKEPDPFSSTISIDAVGWKINESQCVVLMRTKLIFESLIIVPYAQNVFTGNRTLAPYFLGIGGKLLTGDRYLMQIKLEKAVAELSDELYLKISRAKDETFSKFPSIKKTMMKIKKERMKKSSQGGDEFRGYYHDPTIDQYLPQHE